MIVNLKQIIDMAEKDDFAIPAFNVFNTETVMGGCKSRRGSKSSCYHPGLSTSFE